VIALELELIAPLGDLNARPWADEVTGVQIDSRRIEEGDLFVALGPGRDFIAHALARGAGATLIPDDPHTALAALGAAVRDRSRARVVGITGAIGKTTTRQILQALCEPIRPTVATEANYNNELGVPLTLCRLERDTEICLVEMGMRGLGQITWLAGFVRPEIGLITNIAPVHLEALGSIENVARAKAELVAALPPGGIAVVPDDPLLEPYLDRDDIEIRRFGHVTEPGRYTLGDRTVALETSYHSRHQLDNTLAALVVCDALGIPAPTGVLEVHFGPLREELIELADGVLLLNDCYNASPSAMRAALEYLATLAGERRRVAILGEMAELGEHSARAHSALGVAVAQAGVSELIAVGERAQAYAEHADGVAVTLAPSVQDAIEAFARIVRPGDVVLIKGSRAAGLETVAAKLRT